MSFLLAGELMQNRDQNFNRVLKSIVQAKLTCYFISPHLDDAILSSGALIKELSGKVPVKVINVFTSPGVEPQTLSGKTFLKQVGYDNAQKLYKDRRKEDREVFKKLGIKPLNMGFIDAQGRLKSKVGKLRELLGNILPEFTHSHPTYRLHVIRGGINKDDEKLMIEIENKLKTLIVDRKSIVICPIGTGKHVDHIMVREVCRKNFPNVILCRDGSYDNKKAGSELFPEKSDLKTYSYSKNLKEKKRLILGYKSQVNALYPNGINNLSERYYV